MELCDLKDAYERKIRNCEMEHINGIKNAREELLKVMEKFKMKKMTT